MASMQGLRDLYVVLKDPSPHRIWETNWLALEEQLLEPVKKVVIPVCAELVLPYATCEVERYMGPSKVRLSRPPGTDGAV